MIKTVKRLQEITERTRCFPTVFAIKYEIPHQIYSVCNIDIVPLGKCAVFAYIRAVLFISAHATYFSKTFKLFHTQECDHLHFA